MSNINLEEWDAGFPGWQYTYFNAAMVEPTYQPLIGIPVAWTAGTNGPVTGSAILASIQTPADLDKWHGKLEGKIVLTVTPPDLSFPTSPLARRYTPDELAEIATELIPTGNAGGRGGRGGRGGPATANMTFEEIQAFQAKQRTFLKDEKVMLSVTAVPRTAPTRPTCPRSP